VSLLRPNRLNLSRFSFAFFGLALAVFTWGLQYKLSLYDPPEAPSHTIPEAKILCEDEQAVVADGVTIADTKIPADLILACGVLSLFLFAHVPPIAAAERRAEQDHELPRSVSCSAGMNAFFFRPPPALA
jgi:hypothetical protein